MAYFFKNIQNIPGVVMAGFTAMHCAFLLAFAFVLEAFVALTPCPLCIAQRFFFLLIGMVAVGFIWWPKVVTARIAGIKITAYALIGGAIAGRQVWMQWHPAAIDPTRCGVSFGSFIDKFLQALGGTGDCARVDWTLLGLSIAEWSLLSFGLLLAVGVWFLWKGFASSKV